MSSNIEGEIISIRIFGNIRDSKNKEPIAKAKIQLNIEGKLITSVTTDEQGEYEYTAEEDYLEQTLDFIIQKEGFERKNISCEIDRPEIRSDILLNELEIGTIEKTRIYGTIRNSKNRDPVEDANITLNIEGTQIASISSDKQGEYEYTVDEDYTGQTLDFIIQKKGFIKKNISSEIDGLEIKSDILMDEIEIEIKGKICDKAGSPLADASISFSVGNKTINLTSGKEGSFSFNVGQQFLNQAIGYEVSKEGFKTKSGKLELIKDLKCINIHQKGPFIPKWIIVAAIGIILIVIYYIFFIPELLTDPDPLEFNFEPGTNYQTFSIQNGGGGTLEWYAYSDRDWITIYPDSGTGSGKVTISVNSAFMHPGMHPGEFVVESNGGNKKGMLFLHIPEDSEPQSRPPIIHNFMADPEYINGPGDTTLRWEVSGATRVVIDGVGPVELSRGSIDEWIDETTTFTIIAMNDAGEVSETITVYVEKS